MSKFDEQVGYPRVRGVCPSCGGNSLFLGAGGYITCSIIGGCKQPDAAYVALEKRIQPDRLRPHHTVTIDSDGWHLAHPLDCDLARCKFDAIARRWHGPPTSDGTYVWEELDEDGHQWKNLQ